MSIAKFMLAASALAAFAGAAAAAPTHLSDAQYVAANRCLGLMESKTLGSPEVTAMQAVIKAQTFGREDLARDRADTARSAAKDQANRANGDMKVRLTAERDGACRAWLPATQTTAASSQTHND